MNWQELGPGENQPTPGEVKAGNALYRQLQDKWFDEGQRMYEAGFDVWECWNQQQRLGWETAAAWEQAQDVDAAQASPAQWEQ